MKHHLACTKIIAELFETLMAILHSLNHRWKVAEVRLQVADEQRRLMGRGYDRRIVRVRGQLNVV
jgi:hypothetical protein